jgi:hypothetical protein
MKTMERYEVKRTFHFSVLGRHINQGSIIEVNRENSVLRIDKHVPNLRSQDGIEEAIRVVTALAGTDKKILEELPDIESGPRPITQTLTMFPVLGCLKAAEEWLGKELYWNVVNDDQQEFMDLFYEKGMDGIPKLGEELRRKAAPDIDTINNWLAENGFEVKLTVDPGAGGFAVASILDVLVEWMKKGSRRKITNELGTFDGVKLKQDQGVTILQNAAVHNHPVARIATKSGDKVYMTPLDGLPDERFAIESRIRSIMLGLNHQDYRYEGVVFPMVNYDRQPDISFLHGLNTPTVAPGYYVTQAVQQTKFRMNEVGARVESAAAMTMRRKITNVKEPLVIDQPFLLWIVRDGIDMPLFGGVFAEDVWEDPKTLE